MDKRLSALFLTFAKIGLFTFGGGYAMIPLIEREAGQRRHWIDGDDLIDVIAIAESTPGPIAVNAATFIGHKVAGVRGALCATLGVVLPSFLIIALVSTALQAVRHVRLVQYAFWGIRAGVLALILKALWSMLVKCDRDAFAIAGMVLSFLAVALCRVNAIAVIAVCAVFGVLRERGRGRGA